MFVKICGITSEEDALLAVAMGADAVGFILAPSTRQVHPELVADVCKRLPPEVLTVGVFRNEAPERVVRLVHRCRLRGAQLHGGEAPSECRWIAERIPFTIKALVAGGPEARVAGDYGTDVILLEGAVPGSGKVFDWTLADAVKGPARLLLAGGLDPSNVAAAIAAVRPWGVDVASGVESSPGRKDPRKLKAFVAAARLAAPPSWHAEDEAPYDWQEAP